MKEDYSLDAVLCFHTSSPPSGWRGLSLDAAPVYFRRRCQTSALTFKEESGPGYWVPHQ